MPGVTSYPCVLLLASASSASPRAGRVAGTCTCALPTSQDAAILQANDAVVGALKWRVKNPPGFTAGALHQYTIELPLMDTSPKMVRGRRPSIIGSLLSACA